MFDKNFYPTPDNVISKMLIGVDLMHKKILEPSAGKGNICDYIIKHLPYRMGSNYNKSHMYCIEKNAELQYILKEKGYKVLHDDFITYNSDYIFDIIIMNPPFDNGAKHLLKSIEISKGAKIICLLNSETLNNPFSKERQLLVQMIAKNGSVEELGACFGDSERKTKVNVSLVRYQEKNYKSEFKFDGTKDHIENIQDIKNYDIANKDVFGNLEIRYNKIKELTKQMLQIQSKMEYYSEGLIDDNKGILELIKESHENNRNSYYNNFIESFRSSCWSTILRKTDISNFTTKKVRENFYKYQEQQGYMAFTKENMEKLLKELYLNQENIMQSCIEEAFDLMTKYYKENRVYVEGWKTNDQWKVNKKVILPRMRDDWQGYPCLSYTAKDTLNDIEKAICFITKKNIKNITSIESVIEKYLTESKEKNNYIDYSMKFGKWYDSEYFKFKMFKKGTMHIEFKDSIIHEKFNQLACKYKQWLGYN
jgi:hypothetical protein